MGVTADSDEGTEEDFDEMMSEDDELGVGRRVLEHRRETGQGRVSRVPVDDDEQDPRPRVVR